MKAAVLYENMELKYEDYKNPEISDTDVLINIKAAGICGSDKARFIGKERLHHYPSVLGHEFAGVVAETGKNVTTIKIGDRVAGVPILPCHACAECQLGYFAQCKNYDFVGVQIQGSYAEYIKIPERNALLLPDGISFAEGALIEPSTVALHGLDLVDYHPGGDVAILGGGTIGLLTLIWAKLFGAHTAVVFDIDGEMLELAERFGADAVFNTREDGYFERAWEYTRGSGFSYVFETAGADEMFKAAFRLAGNKSRICYIGIPQEKLTYTNDVFFNMFKKEFTLTGVLMSFSAPFPGREWDLTLKFLRNGRLVFPGELISATLPLREIGRVQEMLRVPGSVKGKIVLTND